MATLNLNQETFQREALQSDQPVLVDFWAPWCGPCRAMGEAVDQAAAKLQGKAKVAKVNVDENPELANRYSVQSIPAFVVLKDGEVMAKQLGVAPVESLIDLVKPHLA